jgi:hypothetical protein
MWEVLYTDEFGAWFETLTEDQQDAVIARVDLLEEKGRRSVGRPWTRSPAPATRT